MSTPVTENGWKTVPLAEVVDILDSRRIPVNSTERAKRTGDVPYYGATGQVGFIPFGLNTPQLAAALLFGCYDFVNESLSAQES